MLLETRSGRHRQMPVRTTLEAEDRCQAVTWGSANYVITSFPACRTAVSFASRLSLSLSAPVLHACLAPVRETLKLPNIQGRIADACALWLPTTRSILSDLPPLSRTRRLCEIKWKFCSRKEIIPLGFGRISDMRWNMLETHTSLDMFVLRVINQQRYLLLEPFVFFFLLNTVMNSILNLFTAEKYF